MYPRIPWELVADGFGLAGTLWEPFLWRENPLQYFIRRFWSPRKHTASSFSRAYGLFWELNKPSETSYLK